MIRKEEDSEWRANERGSIGKGRERAGQLRIQIAQPVLCLSVVMHGVLMVVVAAPQLDRLKRRTDAGVGGCASKCASTLASGSVCDRLMATMGAAKTGGAPEEGEDAAEADAGPEPSPSPRAGGPAPPVVPVGEASAEPEADG